ncbi:hypothetical protein ACNKHU_19995 [Shigella flexneri]
MEITYQELFDGTPPAPRTSGLMARVGKLWVNAKTQSIRQCVFYMWGGVGRGNPAIDLSIKACRESGAAPAPPLLCCGARRANSNSKPRHPLEIIADGFKAERRALF